MRPISIRIQKKLMYIPIVNLANIFIWLYNSIVLYKNINTTPRSFITLLLAVFPCYLINEHFVPYSPIFGTIVLAVYGYSVPVILGHCFIKYQEELSSRNKNEEI